MSEFKFSCPNCDQHILCDEQLSGREIECPNCRQLLHVPSAPESDSGPAQRPPAALAPQPLAAQALAPRNDRRNLRAGLKVAPAISAGLAVVVTGVLLLWSMWGLWQLYSREAAIHQEQNDINARRRELWQEYEKQSAQQQARFKRSQELWLQRERERNQKQQEQRVQPNERQAQLLREDSQLLARSSQLPRNSSEYRAVYNRLQVVRAELSAIEKQEQAELRDLFLAVEASDLEVKLLKLPRRSPEYQAISNQLQNLRTELRKRGEAAELSPEETAAMSSRTSASSNLLKEFNALGEVSMNPRRRCRLLPYVGSWFLADR